MSPLSLPTYNLHGLLVRSQVRLPDPVVRSRSVDLDVRWGRRHPTEQSDLPSGRIVAQLTFADGRGYCMTRTDTGWTLRFDGIGEFRFDAALRRVRIHVAPGGDRAIIPLLLSGNVAAFVLTLTGKCILHASAVEIDGAAIGFLGASGMGKSTLAALCCASGARLVTDDVLRVESAPGGCSCVRGPSEIRLRERAATLARGFPDAAVRRTADQRFGVRAERATRDRLPLRLLVIPQPSRDCHQISLVRLTGVESLYALARYARIVGWCAPDIVAEQFAQLGRVAAALPVYSATLPWGPPFPPTLGTTLLESLNALVRADA